VPRVGIYFDLRNPARWLRPWADLYARCLEISETAERLGIDSVWLSEHHMFADGYLPQPLTFAAALAARTKKIKIGTAVLIAPLRSVATIAEEAAIVDILSAGRLELGLGAGYRLPEFELFGAAIADRYRTTDRYVRELQRIWNEGTITPPPVQNPLPLWLGYQGPIGARRAGRLGVGLLSLTPQSFEPYRQGLEEGGHPPQAARLAGLVNGLVTRDPEATWARVRSHVAYQWDSYSAYAVEGTTEQPRNQTDPDRLRVERPGRLPRFVVATPEEIARLLKSYLGDRPVQDIYFWASLAGMPDDIVDEHVTLIATALRQQLS
jgi:alkanesulfonate monooxygenase SsuD/methylene tetrahydromethanopterin reductase-like flavin-dependent oxidoreductase (luciferase family)